MWLSMTRFLKLVSSQNQKLDFFVSVVFAICVFLFFTKPRITFLISAVIFTGYLVFKLKYLFIGIVIFTLMVVVMLLFGAKGQLSTVSGVYKVVDITSFGPVIKVSGTKVLVNTYDDFYLGNYIEISGSLKAPEISSNGFNLPEYLLSLNIKSIYKGEVKLFNDGRDIRMFLSKFLNNGRELYKKYAPLLLIGEKGNESKEVYKIALEMNVVHLFVISGFHLSLLNKLTNKIFKVIKIKDKTGEAISLVVVLFYIYLLNSSISSLRAFLLLLFNYINKYYFKKKYSGLNVLNSVTITMMVIAP